MGVGNYEKDYKPERLEFALSRWKPPIEGIGGFCVISPKAQIGQGVQVGSHVVIHDNVQIGSYCIIKDHAVIGAPGFGFAHDEDGIPIRIHHDGGVIIRPFAEIGSFTTVCAGTVSPSVVGQHVKIDDHVHIAHNVTIGDRSCVAAGAIIGGSALIGDDCWIGINATVKQRVRIGYRCLIGMGAVITKDVPDRAIVAGNPGRILRYA